MEIKSGNETVDGLLRNKIRVIQAARGYRVSEDTVILIWFTRPEAGELILDAGTGCGAIAFGIAVKKPCLTVVGLEIQDQLASRASRGAKLNRLENRVLIVRGDLREADNCFKKGIFDLVVSNPPYHEPGRGRMNLEEEKALSRHQMMMPIEELFRVSSYLLKQEGRLSLIYPANGIERLKKAMLNTGFGVARMLWIHPYKTAAPNLVCVEARKRPTESEPLVNKLVLYDTEGKRTNVAEAIMAGEEVSGY